MPEEHECRSARDLEEQVCEDLDVQPRDIRIVEISDEQGNITDRWAELVGDADE